jgi:hypothetical protein
MLMPSVCHDPSNAYAMLSDGSASSSSPPTAFAVAFDSASALALPLFTFYCVFAFALRLSRKAKHFVVSKERKDK